MKKLVRLLRQAHAIEVGAYHAYEGHWRSLAEDRLDLAVDIVGIQSDEQRHRHNLERYLRSQNAKPSRFLDAVFWCIGKSISFSCYIMPRRMAMWGAKIMEILGSRVYRKLAAEAIDKDMLYMGTELYKMARQEEEHEEFFRTYLEP